MMMGAPTNQIIEKVVDAPSEVVAIRRAQAQFPNQQFVQVTAISLDPQTHQPTGQPPVQQQTTMGRMRGLTPLRALRVPGQQQESLDIKRLSYPYSITLPSQFGRLLSETSPVAIYEQSGQHRIILENEERMRGFLYCLARHRDRKGASLIVDGIRSSIP